jgi:hypothetical protein
MEVDFIKLTTENHEVFGDQTMKLQASKGDGGPLLPFIRQQQAPNGNGEPITAIHQKARSSKWQWQTCYCHSSESNKLQAQKMS